MALYLNPASMYYSPMQLELLTLRFRQTSGMISQQIFFNGVQMLAGRLQNIGLYMGGHRVYNKNIGNEVLPEAQASNRRNLNI